RASGILVRRAALEQEIEETNRRIREAAEERWKRASEEEGNAIEIRRLEEEVRVRKDENARIQEQVTHSRAELLQRKQQTLDLFRDESEKRNELGNIETRVAHFREREESLEARLGALAREEASLAEQAAGAEEAHAARCAEGERLREERARAEADLERARALQAEVAESLVLLQGKRESLDATLQLLLRLRRDYEGYRDGVRTLLTEKPAGGSILGVAAELIEVREPEYRAAFENALGDALQCVLVGSDGDAVDLLRYLRSNEKGWAALLSKERVRGAAPVPPAELLAEDGVLGPASGFVRAADGAERLIELLLADVVFARDLDAASRLARDERWRAFRFVTASGEAARFPGILYGGRRAGEETGIFERRSRIAEVESDLKEAAIGVERMIDARDKADAGGEQCRADRERIYAELDAALRRTEESGRERARLTAALESVRRSIEALRAERDAIAAEREKGRSHLDSVRLEFQVIGADGSEADRSLREIEAEMVELEMKRDEARRLLAAGQIALAEAEGRKNALAADLGSLDRRERELGDEVTRRREELAAGVRVLEETSARQGELRLGEARLAERREGEGRARDEILALVSRLRSEIREREDSIRGDRKEKETLAEELHHLDLRLQEIQLSKRNLVERTNEEFGVSLEETIGAEIPEGMSEEDMRREIASRKESLRRLGPVKLVALDEYQEENDSSQFLRAPEADL
ncbi:MAG: hypothetical protein EHM19_11555, partial [Candidatus Latescibacterota bacterium]